MNGQIKAALENGDAALLLGAGASVGSTDSRDRPLLTAAELAPELATAAGLPYAGEPLKTTYEAAKSVLGDRIRKIFEERFRYCKPSPTYLELSKHAWGRIYTLNVDDALDIALAKNSPQNVAVRGRRSRLEDQDQLVQRLDYIKLNGSITALDEGLIFSPQEYAQALANPPVWYQQLGVDFFKFAFIFVGTSLDESVFFQQIERYREIAQSREGESFLITPTITPIQRASLAANRITHIQGTLDEFARWLNATFPTPLAPTQIVLKKYPHLSYALKQAANDEERYRFARTFENVVKVDRSSLATVLNKGEGSRTIQAFYQGFKPTWADIANDIPATLRATREFAEITRKQIGVSQLSVLYGPAGAGKSTVLMQVAAELAKEDRLPVYFLTKPIDNLEEIVIALEESHPKNYLLFTDKLDSIALQLKKLLQERRITHGLIVGSERQNVWMWRTKDHLASYESAVYRLADVDEADAREILKKVELYGPWNRLAKLSEKQRVAELTTKAKRQLLIGLLETTSGIGFEQLIEEDYKRLDSDEQRLFLVIVGLATIHRSGFQESFVNRALRAAGIPQGCVRFFRSMSGIIAVGDGIVFARHPVYVRHLFENIISPADIHGGIKAVLEAYAAYRAPIARHSGKTERYVFKSILNHRFLREILRGQTKLVLDVFRSFEKAFQDDGMFWLHYGLALRDQNQHDEAFAKLQTAYDTYASVQADHALAQQKLIIAMRTDRQSRAYLYLSEAKEALERLDHVRELSDAYPMVTLPEGHTAIVAKFDGERAASEVAAFYANLLGRRAKEKGAGRRLQECVDRLRRFAVSPQTFMDFQFDKSQDD